MKQVTAIHQASNKQVGPIHLFGPNKELCLGTVEYIIVSMIQVNVIQLAIEQVYKNPDLSILHSDVIQSLQAIAEYCKFDISFAKQTISEDLFSKLKAGALTASNFKQAHGSMEQIVVNGNTVKGIDQRAMATLEFNTIKERIS